VRSSVGEKEHWSRGGRRGVTWRLSAGDRCGRSRLSWQMSVLEFVAGIQSCLWPLHHCFAWGESSNRRAACGVR